MPPTTVNGNVTRPQITIMMQIVPNGSAWVLPWTHATVFNTEKTTRRGPQKRPAQSSTLETQWRPPSFRYQTPET